jgi:hypothetical protein
MAKKPTKIPALKTPPSSAAPDVRGFLQDVKTVIDNIGDVVGADLATKSDVQQAVKSIKIPDSGIQGPPGPPGPPGSPGQTSYFHVAYADSADGSVNFNQTSGVYIGTYVDYVEADSQNYSDYTWRKFEGTDGIPGQDGVNGKTSYLHLKYSDDGVTFTPDTGNGIGETPGAWLGQYVDFVEADSTNFSDYTWAKIKGPDGVSSYLHIAYAASADGTVGFSTTVQNKYIGIYVDTIQADSTDPADYSWSLFEAENGVPGANGYVHIKYSPDGLVFSGNNGEDPAEWMGQYTDNILADSNVFSDYTWAKVKGDEGAPAYLHIAYANSADGTVDFSFTNPGEYIGTYTDAIATSSTDPAAYTWAKIKGTDGIGIDGTSSYLHLKYSNDGATFTPDTGNGIGEDVGDWLGQYVDSNPTDSTTFSDYKWKLIKGPQGPQGVQGPPGDDGQTTYTWIRYADDAVGNGISNDPTGKTYIGFAYNKTTPTESNTPSDYTWSLIQGPQGVQGPPGDDGQPTYTWIKYSDDPYQSVTSLYDQPTSSTVSIGIAPNKLTQTESTNPADYIWSKFKGDPGPQGPQGNDGTPAYFFTAYADDGIGTNMSFTYSNQPYMGTYTSSNPAQSTNAADYTWVKIRGNDGAGLPQDSVTPGAVTGLTAVASRTFAILSWDNVPASYDLQEFLIYRNQSDDPNTATVIGTSKTTIYQDYTPSDGIYYYWVSARSKGSVNDPNGIEGPKNTDNPTISANVDSKITAANASSYLALDALGAEFIGVANLAAIAADLGVITAGQLKNADNTFNIDLVNKFIEIAGPLGSSNDDYVRIENGKIQQYEWTGTTHQIAQSLNTIETGTANNGDTITLQKYYPTQPSIIVTPYDTPIYKASNSSQDQSIQIRAENVAYNSSLGKWQFDAVARLVLSANNVSTAVNETFGPNSNATIISNTYTTPANTASITVSVDLESVRGTGTAGSYYYRQAAWTLYYAASPNGPITAVPIETVGIGATLNAITRSYTFTFPNSGTWDFAVGVTYSDAGGTFSLSGTSYEYSSETVSNNTATALVSTSYSSSVVYASSNLPNHTHDASWSVYDVSYTVNYYYDISSHPTSFDARAEIHRGHQISPFFSNTLLKGVNNGIFHNESNYDSGNAVDNYNTGAFNTNVEVTAADVDNKPDYAGARVKINSVSATISFRRPITNSTTAVNTLKVNDFNYSLSGSSQLSAGTLVWQAIL